MGKKKRKKKHHRHKAKIDGLFIGQGGMIYFLDETNGDDDNDGLSPQRAKRTQGAVLKMVLVPQNEDLVVYL